MAESGQSLGLRLLGSEIHSLMHHSVSHGLVHQQTISANKPGSAIQPPISSAARSQDSQLGGSGLPQQMGVQGARLLCVQGTCDSIQRIPFFGSSWLLDAQQLAGVSEHALVSLQTKTLHGQGLENLEPRPVAAGDTCAYPCSWNSWHWDIIVSDTEERKCCGSDSNSAHTAWDPRRASGQVRGAAPGGAPWSCPSRPSILIYGILFLPRYSSQRKTYGHLCQSGPPGSRC